MMITSNQRREWGRSGGKKRAAQESFPAHQSYAGKCSAAKNDMAALGHKGAQAFIKKYGYARLYHLCREWRMDHPSKHEQQVIDILDALTLQLNCDYFREYEVAEYLSVDFALPLLSKAIEVNGKVHYDAAFDDPRRPGTRAANDAAKIDRLSRLGWSVLVIDYREMQHIDQLVKEFLLV